MVFEYNYFAERREAPWSRKYNRRHGARTPNHANGGRRMNPLDSITGTIVSGLVLAVILVFVIKAIAGI